MNHFQFHQALFQSTAFVDTIKPKTFNYMIWRELLVWIPGGWVKYQIFCSGLVSERTITVYMLTTKKIEFLLKVRISCRNCY